MGSAKGHHVVGAGALIQKRKTDLIGHNIDAAVYNDAKMGGVDIGQPQVANEPFFLQLLEVEQTVQVTRIRISPGVEL